MRLLLAILYVSLTACGSRVQGSRIHDEAMPYVLDFVREGLARDQAIDMSGISVDFKTIAQIGGDNSDTEGLCYVKSRHIILIRDNWDEATTAQRRELLFHELGHCVLGKEHVKVALAIMSPNLNQDYQLTPPGVWQQLVDEFFGASVVHHVD